MSNDKLGFTFYPKDWWTSESYFELTAIQRYIYLECLFIMYSNDGYMKTQKTQFENRIRATVLDSDWNTVVEKFIIENGSYTHISVNKRLKKAVTNRENGKKGGRPPKPKEPKTETQNNPPLEREREGEREKENNVNEIPVTVTIPDLNPNLHTAISKECATSSIWVETVAMQNKIKPDGVIELLSAFNQHLIIKGKQQTVVGDYKDHFSNWIRKQDLTEYAIVKRTGTNQLAPKSKWDD